MEAHEPSADAKENDQGKKNPLEITKILESILVHASFQELQNLRLVNWTWDLAASRVLSSHCAPITFDGVDYGFTDMQRLVEVLAGSWSFPCISFYVDTNFCAEEVVSDQEKVELVTAFLQGVAPFVKTLTIWDINSTSSSGFCHLHFPVQNADLEYPALQHLILDLEGRETEVEELGHLDFVLDTVRNAPALKQLTLEIYLKRTHAFVPILVQRLTTCPVLRNLSLRGHLREDHFTQMAGLQQLKKLCLELTHSRDLPPENVHNFLILQSSTLMQLSVKCGGFDRRFVSVPPLPKLRSLQILDMSPVATLQISLDKEFPQLQDLKLWLHDLGKFFHGKLSPMRKVLQLDLGESLKDPAVVPQVARILPNLRKLRVDAHSELVSLEQLSALENVEEFVLRGNLACFTQLLTGGSPEEIRELRGLSEVELETRVHEREPPPFLQRLRKLKLEDAYDLELTALVSHLVLLRMDNLTCVDLRDCAAFRLPISDQLLAQMRSKFKLLLNPRAEHSESNGLEEEG